MFLIIIFYCIYFFLRNIECQALTDTSNVDFYTEILYPSFRRHRARLRPFRYSQGSHINRIRGARDLGLKCKIKTY